MLRPSHRAMPILIGLFLGCATENEHAGKRPGSAADTVGGDETGAPDTAAPDTAGGDTSDSATTGTDTSGADTSDTRACERRREVVPLPTHANGPSPYATVIVADIDGGGSPDLLYELWGTTRGVALLPGESIRAGSYVSTAWFPQDLVTEQANFVVGTTGDLDGDGAREIVLGAQSPESADGSLTVWSSVSTVPLARLLIPDLLHGAVTPTIDTGPDVDGDGLAELAFTVRNQDETVENLVVLAGAAAAAGSLDATDALATVEGRGLEYGEQPFVVPDLDGDGLDELAVAAIYDGAGTRLLILPPDVAASGGIVDAHDLPAVFDVLGESAEAFAFDFDGDGLPELFAYDTHSVSGFLGSDLATALRTGGSVTLDAAWLRLDGSEDEELGMSLAPYGDGACETGLAVSAHFANRVYLVPGATLRAGGVVDESALPVLAGSDQWYGYVLTGGGDLDDDGTLDLVVGRVSDQPFDLLLGPGP